MKTAIALFFLVCFTLTSCAGIPKKMKEAFTYCFDNSYTGIDTLLNTNGYYRVTTVTKRYWNKSVDTSYYHYMFYDNGLFTYNFDDFNSKRNQNNKTKRNVSLFLKEISEDVKTEGRKAFYGNDWGRYIITGDTIKLQYWHKGVGLNDFWDADERWGIIKDRKISRGIKSFPITTDEKEKEFIIQYRIKSASDLKDELESESTVIFIPILIKPDYDECWLLKEKWFWCNEQDWKMHVEKINQKKKK